MLPDDLLVPEPEDPPGPRGRPPAHAASERELDVMSVLWDLKSATVAEVRKELIEREEFDSAYTTVLSLLQLLRSKRWVTVQKAGRRHVYTPSVSLNGVRCEALHRCINRYFDGTRESLLRYLVSDRATPPGTLWRLRAYLDERLTRPAAPASGPPGPRAAPE